MGFHIGFHGATMRKSLRLRLCCGSELPGALHCALHYEAVRRAAPLAAPHKMIKMAEDTELHKGFAVQYCAVHTTTNSFTMFINISQCTSPAHCIQFISIKAIEIVSKDF